jgi:hypothetical protein
MPNLEINNLAELDAAYEHSLLITIDREEGRFSCSACSDLDLDVPYDGLDALEAAALQHATTEPLAKDGWTADEWRQDQRERSQPDFGREAV